MMHEIQDDPWSKKPIAFCFCPKGRGLHASIIITSDSEDLCMIDLESSGFIERVLLPPNTTFRKSEISRSTKIAGKNLVSDGSIPIFPDDVGVLRLPKIGGSIGVTIWIIAQSVKNSIVVVKNETEFQFNAQLLMKKQIRCRPRQLLKLKLPTQVLQNRGMRLHNGVTYLLIPNEGGVFEFCQSANKIKLSPIERSHVDEFVQNPTGANTDRLVSAIDDSFIGRTIGPAIVEPSYFVPIIEACIANIGHNKRIVETSLQYLSTCTEGLELIRQHWPENLVAKELVARQPGRV